MSLSVVMHILKLLAVSIVVLAPFAAAEQCSGAYSPECYAHTQPPFFVKAWHPGKSCDDWVQESMEGWVSRCCDIGAGVYADNGCTCPNKGYRWFADKMDGRCQGATACTGRR